MDELVSAPVASLPFAAREPLQPPDAEQLVAFEDVQVSVAVSPGTTTVGSAERETVGAGGALEGVDPPPPPLQPAMASRPNARIKEQVR